MEIVSRSRRAFLSSLALVAGWALWKYLTPRLPLDRRVLVSIPEKDVPPDGALVFRLERVAVMRRGTSFHALSLVCTHLGCTVNVTPGGLSCPCHGSLFDQEGKVLRGPADRPLPQLRVEVHNGLIEVTG